MENKNNKTKDIIIFDLTGKTESVLNKSESINIGDDVLIDVSDAKNIYNKIISKSDKFSLEAEIEKKGLYNVKCKNKNNICVYVKYSDKCYAKLPNTFAINNNFNEVYVEPYRITHNHKDACVELLNSMSHSVTLNTKNNQLSYRVPIDNDLPSLIATYESDYDRFIASRPGWLKMVKAGFEQHPFKQGIPKLFGCDFSIPACIYGKGCCSDEVLDERYGKKTFTEIQQYFSLNDLNKSNLNEI